MDQQGTYLWIKALHIIFMVCWFAGIFYLPRLFVNHALDSAEAVHARLSVMEQKLYRFITPFALLTVALGVWLLSSNWTYYRSAMWMQIKIVLVCLLIAYHVACGHLVKQFAAGQNKRNHVFYRWFNELPVLILFGCIILVVLRPL